MLEASSGRRLGVLVVGVGGAVSTTAVVGIESIKAGSNDFAGLPLAERQRRRDGILPKHAVRRLGPEPRRSRYRGREPQVVDGGQAAAVEPVLRGMRPGRRSAAPAGATTSTATTVPGARGHREAVEAIAGDIRGFRERSGVDGVVVVNLASVEAVAPTWARRRCRRSTGSSRAGRDHPDIGPAMLYAYAAISEGVPPTATSRRA